MKWTSLLALFLFLACQNQQPTNQALLPEVSVVGADKDSHGCIGSAGYTWSVVKDTCIRLFESGTRFTAYDPRTGNTDSTQSAFIVLANDQRRAEAFFGSTDKPIVMDAVPVMEGETMPILFENKTELVKLRYYKDSYQILYQDSIRYIQSYQTPNGLGSLLNKR
jgi:hypothetical protein